MPMNALTYRRGEKRTSEAREIAGDSGNEQRKTTTRRRRRRRHDDHDGNREILLSFYLRARARELAQAFPLDSLFLYDFDYGVAV